MHNQKVTDTTEIKKLSEMLTKANIKHELRQWHDGFIILFPGCDADIVQFEGSEAIDDGFLESIRLREATEELDDRIQIWANAEILFNHLLTIKDTL